MSSQSNNTQKSHILYYFISHCNAQSQITILINIAVYTTTSNIAQIGLSSIIITITRTIKSLVPKFWGWLMHF